MFTKHETCLQYYKRRLSEGWKEIKRDGFNVVLLSPEGIERKIDLRNDVETLRPNGVGNSTQLAPVGDTNNWECVDEASADEDSTYVQQTSAQETLKDTYALPASGVGAGTINKVTVYVRHKTNNTGDFEGSFVLRTNSNDIKPSLTPGTSYNTESTIFENNPITTDPWTWEEIDALEAGVELTNTSLRSSIDNRCTQVYVEVDYEAAAPPAVEDPPVVELIIGGKQKPRRSGQQSSTSFSRMKYVVIIIIFIAGFGLGYMAMPQKITEVPISQDCPDVFGGTVETTEGWIGITGHPYHSSNGGEVAELAKALHGDGVWECDKDCWFILKLSQRYIIKKVRINSKDKLKVNIYVSDNKEDWGLPVATNVSIGESDVVNKIGNYIKVEGKNLKWGRNGKIFDAYGESILIKTEEQVPEVTF